jgi:transposase
MSESAAPPTGQRKRRGGRVRFTPELAERIVALARFGNHRDTICHAADITTATLNRWLADRHRAAFREAFLHAEAEAESRNLSVIARAAGEDWHAAAWLLERRYPDRWARASQREKASAIRQQQGNVQIGDPFAEVDELAARRRSDA